MRPHDGADHAAVFKLVEAAAGGGEDHDRQTGVAEDEQFHVPAEARGIPLVILAIHCFPCFGRVPVTHPERLADPSWPTLLERQREGIERGPLENCCVLDTLTFTG